MAPELLGTPCRAFNILSILALDDPRDGRRKVVLSNFVAGATGSLIFVDTESGAGETVPLPADQGAWALHLLEPNTLLVGTCPEAGFLHRLDLATRSWAEPLRCDGVSYIWQLCAGSDGMIYGGTYPGCFLLRYDPAQHRLENLGPASEHEKNWYSRRVFGEVPGKILVECGMASRHLSYYDVDDGAFRRFGDDGATVDRITRHMLRLDTPAGPRCYRLPELTPLASDCSGAFPQEPSPPYPGTSRAVAVDEKRTFFLRGQSYCIGDGGRSRRPTLVPIPAARPPTRIHTLAAGADGRVWGSCGFGQTIFSYDPLTGEEWNSDVVCNAGGEVYGMVWSDGRLFLTAYAGGDHMVYDPREPWNQLDNRNPRTLESVAPEYIRPETGSVLGPDGGIWTGWLAKYGTYGGCLTRVDPETLELHRWDKPVPGQGLSRIAADHRFLYFTTGAHANGLPPATGPFHLLVWHPDGSQHAALVLPEGTLVRSMVAVGGMLVASVGSELLVFDPEDIGAYDSVSLPEAVELLVTIGDGTALAFGTKRVFSVDPQARTATDIGSSPGRVRTGTVAPGGTVYGACGLELYRMDRD